MWSNSFSSSVNREGIRAGGGYAGSYISSRRPYYPHYHHAYRGQGSVPRSQVRIVPKIAHPSPRETPTTLNRKASSPLPTTTPSPSINLDLLVHGKECALLGDSRIGNIQRQGNDSMKPNTITLQELRQAKILELLETSERDLCLEHISTKDFQNWLFENPELADKFIRYEYNSVTERLIVKCMSTAIHDTLQLFFNQTFSAFLVGKLGLFGANKLFSLASGTCM